MASPPLVSTVASRFRCRFRRSDLVRNRARARARATLKPEMHPETTDDQNLPLQYHTTGPSSFFPCGWSYNGLGGEIYDVLRVCFDQVTTALLSRACENSPSKKAKCAATAALWAAGACGRAVVGFASGPAADQMVQPPSAFRIAHDARATSAAASRFYLSARTIVALRPSPQRTAFSVHEPCPSPTQDGDVDFQQVEVKYPPTHHRKINTQQAAGCAGNLISRTEVKCETPAYQAPAFTLNAFTLNAPYSPQNVPRTR